METVGIYNKKILIFVLKYVMYVYALIDENHNVKYVGITTKNIKSRYRQHIVNAKNNSRNYYVYNWMNKYYAKFGVFPDIILLDDSAKNIEELNQLEIYYIQKYDNLTNRTVGGEGTSGYKWKDIDFLKRCHEVIQYNTDGIYINTYKSLSDAAEIVTGDRKNNTKISLVCCGKRKTAYGFVWRKEGDPFDKYEVKHLPTVISDSHKLLLSNRMKIHSNNPSKKGVDNLRSICIGQYLNDELVKVYPNRQFLKGHFPIWGVDISIKTGEERYGFLWKIIDKEIVQTLEKSKIQQSQP